MRTDEISLSCMPLWIEMSLGGSLKTLRDDKIEEEQNHQTLDKENEECFDAHEEKEQNETKELELSKTQQKRQAQKLHWGIMRLQN